MDKPDMHMHATTALKKLHEQECFRGRVLCSECIHVLKTMLDNAFAAGELWGLDQSTRMDRRQVMGRILHLDSEGHPRG